MNNVPSENILKLIALTDKLIAEDERDYELVISKLKEIIECGKMEALKCRTFKNKIRCYESMCETITSVLNNIQII